MLLIVAEMVNKVGNYILKLIKLLKMNYLELKKYTVIYNFHHSRMGFNNSLTTEQLSENHALVYVMEEVKKVYGAKMFKRFTFKIK